MRSIFVAMVWETLKRGWWLLPFGIFGGNFLTVVFLASLRAKHIEITDDPAFVILQMTTIQVNLLTLASIVAIALGKVDRLFTLPITNRTIVAYHVAIGMTLMIAGSLVSTALVNGLFGTNWPYWGPALFGAAGLVVVSAMGWLGDHSLWLAVLLAAVGAPAAVWFRCRYGPFFSRDPAPWDHLTLGEVATLAAAAALAFPVAVAGVARKRRGEAPLSIGFIDWVRRKLDDSPGVGPSFDSRAAAQRWYEVQRGALMPALVLCFFVGGLICWALFDRNTPTLFEGLFDSGYGLMMTVGMIGGIFSGDRRSAPANSEMGPFLGTLPMTSKEMANIILKIVARGVATVWLLWLLAVVALFLVLSALHLPATNGRWDRLDFRVVGISLVGCWVTAGLGLTCLLLGRLRLLAITGFIGMAVAIAWLIITNHLVPYGMREQAQHVTAALLGVAAILATATAYVLARRANLIDGPRMLGGLVIGIASLAAIALFQDRSMLTAGPVLFVVGVACLAAAPLASAPLALAWNRVR